MTPVPAYTPLPLAPGVAVALYDGVDSRALALLERCKGAIRMPHTGPHGFARADAHKPGAWASAPWLDRVLAALTTVYDPGARLWFGIGEDWLVGLAHAGHLDTAVDLLCGVGAVAVASGAECLVHDDEGASQEYPDASAALARAALPRMRAAHPGLRHLFTSYDDLDQQPKGHDAWAAWLHLVDGYMGQVYEGNRAKGVMAPKGAVAGRMQRHLASVARLTTLGVIPPGLPLYPYFQMHNVPFAQTATTGAAWPIVGLWDAHTERDADGECAAELLVKLKAAGLDTRAKIAAWQAAGGDSQPDGTVGRYSAKLLGVEVA